MRFLLGKYEHIISAMGEVMGALTLRTDLNMIASFIKEIIGKISASLCELEDLQGMGHTTIFNSSNEPEVNDRYCLIDVINSVGTHSTELKIWSAQSLPREKSIIDFRHRLDICKKELEKIYYYTDCHRLIRVMNKTGRDFHLTRFMLLIGLSEQISASQKKELSRGDDIMRQWLDMVHKSISKTTFTGEVKHLQSYPASLPINIPPRLNFSSGTS